MKNVLLITDTERVQRVFASLEREGVLQLRSAATLTQGDQEIAESAPEVTFVQSRISGFSGLIMLRHLKKALPKQAKVVLLAGDADDAEQARQDDVPCLDLTLDDEALSGAVRQVIEGTGRAPRQKGAAPKAATAGKGRQAKAAKQAPATPAPPRVVPPPASAGAAAEKREEPEVKEPPVPEVAVPEVTEATEATEVTEVTELPPEVKEPVQELPGAPELSGAPPVIGSQEPTTPEAAARLPVSEEKEPVAAQAPYPEETHPAAVKAASPSFEEVMRRASAQSDAAPPGPLEVEDRVHLGKQAAEPTKAPKAQGRPEQEEAGVAPPEELPQGEPLADALLRAQKKKQPSWLIPLAVALVFVPLLVFYLVGRKGGEPAPTTAPEPTTAPAPTTAPGAGPTAAPTEPAPTTTLPPSPAPTPAPMAGLKTLPPLLDGLRLDADYGKTNPGWARYLGASAEYKLFREHDVYRAIQVIALPGQAIPDRLFKRVLLEFGGNDSYRVDSTGKKGDYALEHGTVNGNVGLTIYRRKSDLQMKGFVVFYR